MDDIQFRFESLVAGFCDGTLTSSEVTELLDLVRADGTLLEKMQDELVADSILVQLHEEEAKFRDRIEQAIWTRKVPGDRNIEDLVDDALNVSRYSSPHPQSDGGLDVDGRAAVRGDTVEGGIVGANAGRGNGPRNVFAIWIPWGVVVALLAVTASMWFRENPVVERSGAGSVGSNSGVAKSVEEPEPVVEVESKKNLVIEPADQMICSVVNGTAMKAAGDVPLKSGSLRAGEYRVEKGAAGLQFRSGVQVAVRGPASFELIDESTLRMRSGVARFVIPASIDNFVVYVAGGRYSHHGSEFGLAVNPDSYNADFLAFEGNGVLIDESGTQLAVVDQWHSIRMTSIGQVHAIDPNEDQFLSPADVKFVQWSVESLNRSADRDLLTYFTWRDESDDGVLMNEAVRGGTATPVVNGTRTVSGRWNGKSAVLFDGADDWIEFSFPQKLETMTISTWINIHRLDHSINSIFNSTGWSEGAVHLQAMRSGEVWVWVFGEQVKSGLAPRLNLGQWHHLTAVIDCKSHCTKLYLDGVLANESPMPEGIAFVQPGICRLGNWDNDQDKYTGGSRALRGRMDEFAVWKRVLDDDEIRDLWQSGNPYVAR